MHTLEDADLIFVMKHGEIVEEGNHDQLRALNGLYATMVRGQDEALSHKLFGLAEKLDS
jgi:ABC-type multidrug transport system fused ATPase/permease subunit